MALRGQERGGEGEGRVREWESKRKVIYNEKIVVKK